MRSRQAPAPRAWPGLADAGDLLVSALHQDVPGPWEPADGWHLGRAARRPAGRGDMTPQHEPLELAVLGRVLDGLKRLSTEHGRDEPAPWPTGMPGVESRDVDLAVWPLFAGLGPLGALSTVPRVVRSFSKVVLGIWDLTAFTGDTELLMSELATNAVAAATGPDGRPRYDDSGSLHLLWARLLSDRTRLRIELWDTVPEELGVPVKRQADTTDESGRGLELIDALSATWGWEPVPGRAVKKVWAELPKPADEEAARTA